jgi:hypothetical protein
MTTHNGQRITQRGGAGAGRGDDAHGVTPQWQTDQHTVAHADGFVGPRIGEAYGSYHDQVDGKTMSGMAPTSQGGMQPSPAGSFIKHSSNTRSGTADRMAHLDNVNSGLNPRMMQHKQTGNIVEVNTFSNGGDQVNTYGTSANGRAMEPREDVNMNPGGKRYGSGIDHTSEDYTDVTDTVRNTQTYKEGRQG